MSACVYYIYRASERMWVSVFIMVSSVSTRERERERRGVKRKPFLGQHGEQIAAELASNQN